MTVPWRDPLDPDEEAEIDAREESDRAWLAYEKWLNRA